MVFAEGSGYPGPMTHDPAWDVLVTGGAGFIGSQLVRHLSREGHRVVVADNLSATHSLRLLDDVDYEFHHVDVRCPEDFALLPRRRFHRIYHLAASFANARSIDFPEADKATNVDGTQNTLNFAGRVGCDLFVYASSSSCYGALPVPFAEDARLAPETPYARSKFAGEMLVRNADIPSATFRLFNVYGPGDWPGPYRNAIPNLFRAATNPTPEVHVFGETATRDFTFVTDVVEVLAQANIPIGTITNIGTGHETSIAALARTIVELVGAPASCIRIGERRDWDGISRRCADVTRLRERFGLVPATELAVGLERTLAWLREQGFVQAGAR